VVAYKMKAGEDHKAEHVVVDKEAHFIWIEDYCVPALRTLHAYHDMYPRFTADEGALRFILKGANLMCPGLLNEQASMDDVEEGAIVAVYVHGHEHCLVKVVRFRL
jgi:malignant T-cell-amplified sequence